MPAEKALKSTSSRLQLIAVYLVAVALLAWAVSDAFQRYKNYTSGPVAQAMDTGSKQQPANAGPKDTRSVARLYLFGKQQLEARPVEITRAPATRLNLTLIGVIAARENQVSKAIIQIGNSATGVYSVGESLPNGKATVERIEATQVLLRRNGKLESLAIERPQLTEEERGKVKGER